MKTKQTAPIGANPLQAFLKKLPKQAAVLGMIGHRSSGKESIQLCYSHHGQVFNTSFSWEGGAL